jgi:hypothetical protein
MDEQSVEELKLISLRAESERLHQQALTFAAEREKIVAETKKLHAQAASGHNHFPRGPSLVRWLVILSIVNGALALTTWILEWRGYAHHP